MFDVDERRGFFIWVSLSHVLRCQIFKMISRIPSNSKRIENNKNVQFLECVLKDMA